ncbi:hexulose-6-phosphate isomerase [Clostridia bacterium]|nr:hexulose-6-phosphate isomerase [Clostridia bacterium]
MKKGINILSLPGHVKIEDAFSIVSRAGFDGIELYLDIDAKGTVKFTNSPDMDVDKVKALSEKYKLKVTGFVTDALWANPLTSCDPETRKRGQSAVKVLIDYAEIFGADTILVVPGSVSADCPYDEAYDNALESLKILAPYAESKKVAIGVENVWNRFLLSPLEARDFIDKINSPYVGAYFDIGNVVVSGFPEQWIKILGKRIKKLHAKGFRGGYQNGAFVNLLEGDINWHRVTAALKAIGYNDYITAELNAYGEFPEELAKETSAAFDAINRL